MPFHWAKLEKSKRLQRLLEYLSDGRERTTLEIILEADISAVSSAVAELRKNNYVINCRRLDRNRWAYQLVKA